MLEAGRISFLGYKFFATFNIFEDSNEILPPAAKKARSKYKIYSSTAIFEAALYKCPSFFIPTSLKYNGNELILKKNLLTIAKQYKKGKILEQIKNPLYISAERSYSFFGLERNNFFSTID